MKVKMDFLKVIDRMHSKYVYYLLNKTDWSDSPRNETSYD